MTKKEANSIALKLHNEWKEQHSNHLEKATTESDIKRENFIRRCQEAHNVRGFYEALSDKNALKMASICSTTRFVAPWKMLLKLQIHVEG